MEYIFIINGLVSMLINRHAQIFIVFTMLFNWLNLLAEGG
jgi:hypothetical protein